MGPGIHIKRILNVFFCLLWLISPAIAAAGKDKPFYRPSPENSRSAIVPQSEAISDFKARLMLAGLLLQSKTPDNLARADAVIDKLADSQPDSRRVKLLRIRLAFLQGNRSRAIDLADDFPVSADSDPKAFQALAKLYASFGQYSKSRDICQKVLAKLDGDEKAQTLMAFADLTILWGDFYTAEEIIRQQLAKDPASESLNLKLARNLSTQQRYDEARKHLLIITKKKNSRPSVHYYEAHAEKVNIALQEGDYAKATSSADAFIEKHGFKDVILMPGARSYQLANRPEDAEALYTKAAAVGRKKAEALTGLGQVKSKRGKPREARQCWEQALAINPQASLPKILLLQAAGDSLPDYIQGLIQEKPGPDRLCDLGDVLAKLGHRELALSCYKAAFASYPDHFPCAVGLAETSAAMGLYDKSTSVLDRLRADYPESYKLALTRARVLSWSARYGDAVDAYEALFQKNPDNFVVLKEAARTAYWGKMADAGRGYYQRIYTPPVDTVLLKRLRGKAEPANDGLLESALEKLDQKADSGSAYNGYETFFHWYEKQGFQLRQRHRQTIENTRAELDYLYQIQKKASLEHQSKHLVYNRRFAPAQRRLRELVEIDAGNQEALFELAQVHCALGLCDQEKQFYEELLKIDPLHGQAAVALERQKTRSRPQIFGAYRFWREKGRGDLAQMERHRADLGIKLPVNCRHKLQVVAHRYMESPLKYADTVEASGLGLRGELVTGPYLSFYGGITRKAYDENLQMTNFSKLTGDNAAREAFRVDLDDITLGYLTAAINLDNYARFEIGYEKAEELVNPVALAQGIYYESLKARLDANLSRRFEIGAGTAYKSYSDGNHGYIYDAAAGYSFTDHPREVKGILSVEYRDTDDLHQGCTAPGGRCLTPDDFRHPYWTPQDYWKTAATLVFRHDLAENFFCGAREHFYDLRITIGTETDQNHSFEIEALWKKEISDRVGVSASAMWHRSKQWDAAALSIDMFVRF
ncbi:tetratricopeptide (TPR) repeat protein [Desulfosalsimonas propionicica]|uniref:Tetratricopeptide (TPR) repeat protein n=1 Tax=Desulfosalsimonas propionicica TaxID=332175 RepID=A0A7W0CAN9_9BACT|nr:tetratricopeptide repeat protein [Desulfosalsimonas propionicica]MBA2882220.1 tetratricopeptide (TPR) repeat protein [Desulfosalsimonas propionicica]